jgi:serine/threonine protein kinase
MELTVQNVYGLLIRSHLVPLEELKAAYARWQQEAGEGAGNLVRFMAWMVSQKLLTEYQATLLARGHADGFFLNEYKILDRLGKGRMAGVYKAQHQLGQIVAIKVLPPSRAKDPSTLARFHREARLSLKLKHPNIVRSFQTGAAGELHYLVMEYLEGETLEEVLARRGKLPPAEAVRLVYQVLQGLQHLHTQGAIHRDLKPANLMLVGSLPDSTLRATVKILDIGLGRALFDEGMADTTVDPAITTEGALLGTPDYMAPEQARDPRAIDIRADIYSTGCVLYHLLAGHPPFPDTNVISQMIRHATETPRPLKEANPAIPDGLQQIVNWMLAKDPAARYPTPERAAQALQVFLAAGDRAPDADDGPQMKSYLTWLEHQSGESPPGAPLVPAQAAGVEPKAPARPTGSKPPSGTLPAASPRPSAPPLPPQPARQRSSSRQASSRHRRKGHRQAPPAVAVSPPPEAVAPAAARPAGEAVPEKFDVELVPLDGVAAPVKIMGLSLSRRDFICFGIGAAAGALATFLGCLGALAGKRHLQRDDHNPPEDNTGEDHKP